MENSVRVGIVGIGNMGTAHLNCIFRGGVDGMTVGAVCDVSPERLDFVRKNYPGVRCFGGIQELFDAGGVDALLIAVPHKYHAEMACAALERGLHVLCEKPIDISVTRAQALNDAARRSKKVFGIMFNQRTNRLFQRARELVHSGQLGELRRTVWIVTNWYRTQHYYNSGGWRATWAGEGGGVLLNQAPHNLDLWQWICGMPVSLTAFCDVAKYHRIEVEDDVTIFTRYQNGATGCFITSTGEYPGTNRLEISGDLGKLVLENGLLKWWRLSESASEVSRTAAGMSAEIPTEYTELAPDAPETAHRGILQNFTNAILHGEPLLAPGTDGIYELMLSNAAYLSSWQGGAEVSLPPDGALFDRLLGEHIAQSHAHTKEPSEQQGGAYQPRWQVRW